MWRPIDRDREGPQIVFYERLARQGGYCQHGGASCSIQKHALIRNGSKGESFELMMARAIAMTIEGHCRCCGQRLSDNRETTMVDSGATCSET